MAAMPLPSGYSRPATTLILCACGAMRLLPTTCPSPEPMLVRVVLGGRLVSSALEAG